MTEPTDGHGAVWRRAEAASATARAIASSSRIAPPHSGQTHPRGATANARDRTRDMRMRSTTPSPIRTLTVGPGLPPGRRTAGGRTFAGFRTREDGRSPPVGTCPQPRGQFSCTWSGYHRGEKMQRVSISPGAQILAAFDDRFGRRASPKTSVGAAAREEVERVRGNRQQDGETLDGA